MKIDLSRRCTAIRYLAVIPLAIFGLLSILATGGGGGGGGSSTPPPTFTVGGTVSGLAGSGLVLQDNAGDSLAISASGAFTFATALADGNAYNVTVLSQPTNPTQTCAVSNGTGTINAANIANVSVSCVTNTFTVGGTVSGLAGSGLVLQNNGGDDLTISGTGAFTFATALADGSTYNVTVLSQPTGPAQICSVTNGSGALSGANVSNVSVSCVNTYTVGGTVSGLAGSGLVLQTNGGDDLAISGDGAFTFATALADGSAYNVTVLSQPTGPAQTCGVTNGGGILSGGNVTDISINCAASNLIFSASDNVTVTALWKSDGTAAGTVLVKDINPTGNSSLDYITVFNGALYFAADDGVNGVELWKSDGTAAGTVLVKDINPTGNSSPDYITVFNGALYFAADDGVNGVELWKSDGTAAGTVLVKDINSGAGSSSPNILYLSVFNGFPVLNGALYFAADDGVNGRELWKSDGTAAGTVLVKDIASGAGGSFDLAFMTVFNGALYFRASGGGNGPEVWKSDGTAAGTLLVKDINPAGLSSPGWFTAFNGALYFTANDGVNGQEVWKTDGTAAGTVLVKNINPGGDSSPAYLTVFNGALYFRADNGVNGFELWKSDGTAPGTVLVKDINPAGGAIPNYLAVLDGALYFSANNGVNGVELWKSDGTAPGTVLVKDINPGAGSSVGFGLGYIAVFNGALYFRADDGVNGPALWKSDGTAAGTILVKDIDPARKSTQFTVF